MIPQSRRLEQFEAAYQREAFRDLSYQQALELFSALWAEARALNPDIGADLAVARAVNGLPPIPDLPGFLARLSETQERRTGP